MYPQITWKCKQTSSPNKGSKVRQYWNQGAGLSAKSTTRLSSRLVTGTPIGKMTAQAFHIPGSNARCVSNNHCHEAKQNHLKISKSQIRSPLFYLMFVESHVAERWKPIKFSVTPQITGDLTNPAKWQPLPILNITDKMFITYKIFIMA